MLVKGNIFLDNHKSSFLSLLSAESELEN